MPKNREPTKEMYIPKKGEGDDGGEKEKPNKKEEGLATHTTQQHPQQQAPRQPQQQQQYQPPKKAQDEKVIHRQFPALHSYPATIFLQGIIYGVSLSLNSPPHSAALTCLSSFLLLPPLDKFGTSTTSTACAPGVQPTNSSE